MRRRILPKDIKLIGCTGYLDEEYKDGVYCECGEAIAFRGREPYEPVYVECPVCHSVIQYG